MQAVDGRAGFAVPMLHRSGRKMNETATVLHPVVMAQVMVNFAASYGVDRETCLSGTGISAEMLNTPDALIRREQEMRLVENMMLALPGVPALGFELGLQYNVATFGIWGFAMRTSRNLREAFQHAVRYLPLSTAYCEFGIFESPHEFGVWADPRRIPQHLRQFLLERDSGTGVTLMRELSLAGVEVQLLEFQGPAPAYVSRIAELCGITPRYGSGRNAIAVNRADADRPLPTFDPHLVRLLEGKCRDQLEQRQTDGITGQVRQQLLGPLGLVATLEDVAKNLAMSPRSLRRKLEQADTSFRHILENERKLMASQLLTSTSMKLEEMALHVGYGDTASFTRAFRRWFGMAPGEYRRQAS